MVFWVDCAASSSLNFSDKYNFSASCDGDTARETTVVTGFTGDFIVGGASVEGGRRGGVVVDRSRNFKATSSSVAFV